MRIAALSDFHIGARAHADGFGHDVEVFERFLDRLERTHDAIVLLGDIWQTDHAVLPTKAAAARASAAARRRLPRLAARWSEPPYIYVHGNHDAIAASELDAPASVVLDGACLVHGHQFDPIATTAPWAAAAGTWATGQLRAVGLRPVAAWFEDRDVGIKDARFGQRDGPYARGAADLARAHDVRFVVMGHTHVPSRWRLKDGVVAINTGTCSRGRTMFASLDTTAGTATVHDGLRPL